MDIQQALDNLRAEIQTDRLAVQDTINKGFDRLADQFVEHARDDVREFTGLKERMASVERSNKIIGGTIVTALTTFLAWIFGR